MRIHSRAELELALIDAEEKALERTAMLVRDAGGTAGEVVAVVETERMEWTRTRNRIIATYEHARIDPHAAEHAVQ